MEGDAESILDILYKRGKIFDEKMEWNVCFKAENASFSIKSLFLKQKRQKKTLAFYVGRPYTEKAWWSKVE